MSLIKYVAFLRGINVGGNKKVPMVQLKIVLEENGFKNVKTILNSGNVIFESEQTNALDLKQKIGQLLRSAFGFEIPVILRTAAEIKKLIDSDPFKGIEVTEKTKLYVTFLSDKLVSKIKIPFETREKDFKIISMTDYEVCSVLTLSDNKNTPDVMGILEKEFGKNVTTRNWNTVVKLKKI